LSIVINNKVPKVNRVFISLLLLSSFIYGNAYAQPLEDITLRTEADRVVATIRLSAPISNVRYTPVKKGSTLTILLDKLPDGSSTELWLDDQVMKSPPSSLIPSFTVKTNLKNIQPKLIIEFSREAEYTVNKGSDGRSIIVNIQIDQALPVSKEVSSSIEGLPLLPEIKPLAAGASDINKQAAELMLQSRNALKASDNFAAIESFNKLLLLPPNDYTQDGQEWVGVARERAGQQDKAKLEYELYLKLYSTGDGVARVKTRLSRLGSKPAHASVTGERAALKKQGKQTLTYGSLSMHYYRGASKIESADKVSQFGDQSALLTSVNATSRFISEEYDNRIVFRDTAYTNFLPDRPNRNRLSAAYFEVKNKLSDYTARMGRQSSNGSGVLGRFDGAAVGYGVTPSLRMNAVAGQLSDYTTGPKPVFFGASMDMGPVTFYGIKQTVDGVLDRQAVGTEIRYFKPNHTAFALIDYDTSFSTLNTAMFQGTLNPNPERTYNLLLDHRKAPYISTRNALNGATTTSITELLQIMTEEELRSLAASRTGTSNMAQLGLTQQMSQKWQLGGDVRVSRFEDMPATGTIDPLTGAPITIAGAFPATPGTGNEWAISTQLIGNGLYSSNDISVFSLSFISAPIYTGQSFFVYNRSKLNEKWSLDSSLQLYRMVYDSGMLMTRIMPMLRTAYQIRQSLSLDMDVGIEMSSTETDTQTSDSTRKFFSLGFRWDF
jgi:hypothetical protein